MPTLEDYHLYNVSFVHIVIDMIRCEQQSFIVIHTFLRSNSQTALVSASPSPFSSVSYFPPPPLPPTHLSLSLFLAELACVCGFFSADQRGSHPVRGNIVNVADTVPSAYLQLVLNNRKLGEMSSPIITSGLFFPSCPYSILGVN